MRNIGRPAFPLPPQAHSGYETRQLKRQIPKTMKRFNLCLILMVFVGWGPISAEENAKRIVIIKADDVRGPTANWKRFFALSKAKGIKVSAGIICESLQQDKNGYHAWLKGLQDSGAVEFWNHGWDHKRWNAKDGRQLCEFKGSGYAHQKQHFVDAQSLMQKVFGAPPIAFGAPYNGMDADTVKVLNENADCRLCFCHTLKGLHGKVLAPMTLRGESDGTGKPNFEKFKAEYQKRKVSFAAIQFHPSGFGDAQFAEYGKIVDFLIKEGWTFMLPAEYVALMEKGDP